MTDQIRSIHDMVIMLLGSGQKEHLEFRKKVRDELVEKGFTRIIIMEESPDDEYTDISLDDKLSRIIKDLDPDLFVVMVMLGWMVLLLS